MLRKYEVRWIILERRMQVDRDISEGAKQAKAVGRWDIRNNPSKRIFLDDARELADPLKAVSVVRVV
jgi:hypothetical protein